MKCYFNEDLDSMIYELYYSCGYSISQIARKLNVSYDYVEDLLGDGAE